MGLKADRQRAVTNAMKDRQKRLGPARERFRKWNQVRQQAAEKKTHESEEPTRDDVISAIIEVVFNDEE